VGNFRLPISPPGPLGAWACPRQAGALRKMKLTSFSPGLIFPMTCLMVILGVFFFLPQSLSAAIQSETKPLQVPSPKKSPENFQTLLNRLAILDEPISREGTGRLIARGPGEYYRLQFRLIARGPEAVRLEIYDPLGRPLYYIISYLGETRVLSLAQMKVMPFKASLTGPLSVISQMPATEMLKLFWGRVPLFPYDSVELKTEEPPDKDSLIIIFDGPFQQELWITSRPFTITKSLLKERDKKGEWEISFSLFSSIAGNQIPLQFEIKEGTGENTMTFRYETLVLRPDIPDDAFSFPDLSSSTPAPKP